MNHNEENTPNPPSEKTPDYMRFLYELAPLMMRFISRRNADRSTRLRFSFNIEFFPPDKDETL